MAALLMFLFLLPLIYVLALGPLVWLHDRGWMSDPFDEVVEAAYWPLEEVSRESWFVDEAIEWYVSLWESAGPAPQ